MSFRIGQRVVCVDPPAQGQDCRSVPIKGGVYTVRGFSDAPHEPDQPAIYLEEIINPPFDYDGWIGEVSFRTWRFRPVHERKTDISIFTAMLDPTRRKELVLTSGKRGEP